MIVLYVRPFCFMLFPLYSHSPNANNITTFQSWSGSSPGFVSTGGVATDVVLELSYGHGIHQHHLLGSVMYIMHSPKHDIQYHNVIYRVCDIMCVYENV